MSINRRHTQTIADSIFSLADLARENLHALRANRFLLKRQYLGLSGFNTMMNFFRNINNINHATRVIGVFFPGRVGREKGLRPSASVCG
jgi:hypothetical protein